MRLLLLLLVAALQACASTTNHDGLTYSPTEEWEDTDAEDDCDDSDDDVCLLPVCSGEACALFRCDDLEPERLAHGRTPSLVRPPARPPSSRRNRGAPQHLPAEPVLVFHFYGTGSEEELPSQAEARRRFAAWRQRPKERHHLFPQAFKKYFKSKGINVHDWVLIIDAKEHARLHNQAERGPWNTEWKEWRKKTQGKARQAEHFEQASYMINKYGLWGLPITYWQTFTLPPLPPP
ncbi:TIGR02269 family lipoprotein [Pyxidicoccus sp. 3LG]